MRSYRGFGPTSERRQRGAAAVEFALVFPLVVLLFLGMVEAALVARTQLELTAAAREGAREAAVATDPARAVAAARAALGALSPEATVSVTRPHTVGARTTVEVGVEYRPAGGLLGLGFPLRASATMRVER